MLANAMAEGGHDVTLISVSADNNCYQLDQRVKYRFLPDRKTNILRLITRYQDIKKQLQELKPDITVNFWFQSAYMTAMMKKSITGKVIYSERGDPGDKEYSGLLGVIRKFTLPQIDGFVFQSKAAQGCFSEAIQKRSTVIPNPVFVRAKDYPEVRERRKAIVTVGRLHPQKNQKLLIDSFALIAGEFPDYKLEIYGEGELKGTLQKYIDDLQLSERVLLKGTSKQLHSLIYDAALFVLSSDYEGMPNTLLEAMALGIPSISTDCKPGGAREIIDDGIDGIIVERNNSVELAKQIKALLDDPEKMSAFSQRSIKGVDRFKARIVYESWSGYFQKLLEG